jgi:hypothetical protein
VGGIGGFRRRVRGHPHGRVALVGLGLARSVQEENLAAVERNYGRDDEETMILRENLDFMGSVELQQKNVDGLRRLCGNLDPRTIRALNYLANTKRRQGDYLGAIPLQLRALTAQIRFRMRIPHSGEPGSAGRR